MEDSVKTDIGYLNKYISFLEINDIDELEFFKENIETIVALNKKELVDYREALLN